MKTSSLINSHNRGQNGFGTTEKIVTLFGSSQENPYLVYLYWFDSELTEKNPVSWEIVFLGGDCCWNNQWQLFNITTLWGANCSWGKGESAWKPKRKIVCVCVHTQPCPTLCDTMDYSLPDSSVCRTFQARILEWVAISFGDTMFTGASKSSDMTLGIQRATGMYRNTYTQKDLRRHSYFTSGWPTWKWMPRQSCKPLAGWSTEDMPNIQSRQPFNRGYEAYWLKYFKGISNH